MSKKQKRTVGSIIEIQLEEGYFAYGQILRAGIAVFDLYVPEHLKDISLLNSATELFIVQVYDDAITNGRWLKIGKLSIRRGFEILPMKFIQDAINPESFQLYDPNTGEIIDAKKEDCIGLECAAVWEAEHVESRIIDYYSGRPNIWVENLKIK